MQKSQKNVRRSSTATTKSAVPAATARKIGPAPLNDVVISHREYVTSLSDNHSTFTLIGSSADVPGYDLNPGNNMLFPWLSRIARNYEKYTFEDVEFELVPRNPTTATGMVYLAFDYDWDDAPATSAQEFMTNRGAMSSDVWTPLRMRVDISRVNQDLRYRYVENVARALDSGRFMFGGYLMVALAGTVAACSFDLFVSYRIRLQLPALHAIQVEETINLPSAATVAAGVHHAFARLPVLGRGVDTVSIGGLGVPALSGAPASGAAYRVSPAAQGTLDISIKPGTTGSPPSAFVTDTYCSAQAYDADGNQLAVGIPGSVFGGNVAPTAPYSMAEWGTNDKLAQTRMSLPLKALRLLYPTLAYIVPYIASTAGRILSTSSEIRSKYVEL